MNTRQRKAALLVTVAAIYFITVLFPAFSLSTYAAGVPKLDEIRVTLFIDGRGTVPAVTLNSANPLHIGIRKPDGISNWLTSAAGNPVRFSLNGYSLRVAETPDYSTAVAAYQSVAATGQAQLFASSLNGQTLYQVRLIGYRTAEEASAARSLIPANVNTTSTGLAISGPLFVSAGTYTTLQEAENHQGSLSHNGIVSTISIHQGNDGEIRYSIWIGEAVSEAELNNVMADAAAKVPGLSLQIASADQPYLLRRTNASLSGVGGEITTHYQLNPQNHNVWLDAGEAGIRVTERSGRTYRGTIELTSYNGKLAVINQLSFEHYLYSVVSSELSASWPIEALKAQAVAARTFAIKQGMKYKIAHISDTTFDQAYNGRNAEFAQAVEAVNATKSEVLIDKDGLITPFYSSNTGGKTADVSEAWVTPVAYIKSKVSPDEDAQKGKPIWYRIMLSDGRSAYISSDYAKLVEQKNSAGLPYVEVTGDSVNIRRAPYVDNSANAAIVQASKGERFVWIGQDIESNPFNWIRGPFTAEQLKSTINSRASNSVSGELKTLEVTGRGPSDRVIAMKANGQELALPNADAFRGAMNGLPSTRFEVEQTGKYTILGAAGSKRELPASAGPLSVISANGTESLKGREFYAMNGAGEVRAATTNAQFRFVGLGFGHGVGMSQYGTKAFAELGYDYQYILKYYYDGVSIVKE